MDRLARKKYLSTLSTEEKDNLLSNSTIGVINLLPPKLSIDNRSLKPIDTSKFMFSHNINNKELILLPNTLSNFDENSKRFFAWIFQEWKI